MMSLLQSLGLDQGLLAQVFAGLAVFLLVVAFLPRVGAGRMARSRVAGVVQKRDAMKEKMRVDAKKKKKGDLDDSTIRVMRRTIERFRMQEMLDNTELRMKLAQAGFRGTKAPIVFLFFRLVAPFLMGGFAMFYFAAIYAAPFEPMRHSIISIVVILVGYALPNVLLKNKTQKRQVSLQRAFPDALDLTVICVEAGMSIEKSFHKVSEEIALQGPELASEIALTNAELAYLGDRSLAYENFARRTGLPAIKALTGAMVQAERYGTPIASALRVLSEESRGERMSIAERKAASLPAKLTVPMIVFFLPVLFVVIIGPAAIQVMAG